MLPSFTATITGFVNGDTQTVVTGLPALTTTATSSSPAGSYPITAALGTLAAANYSFTFGTGTLTITPASNPGVGFTGRAMAGNQPVAGATVQLYAAGTAAMARPEQLSPHQHPDHRRSRSLHAYPPDTPVPPPLRSFTSSSAEDKSEPRRQPGHRTRHGHRRLQCQLAARPRNSSSTRSRPPLQHGDSPSFSPRRQCRINCHQHPRSSPTPSPP